MESMHFDFFEVISMYLALKLMEIFTFASAWHSHFEKLSTNVIVMRRFERQLVLLTKANIAQNYSLFRGWGLGEGDD